MAAPDTPAETFKRALGHAARALAEQPELEVVFGSDGPRLAGGGLTHRLARRLANHDAAINARMRPVDTKAAEVFDAVEQARVEAVGSEYLAGVRDNMGAALVTRLEKTGALRIADADRVPVAEAVA